MAEDICSEFQRCLKEMLDNPASASWHSMSKATRLGLTHHFLACEDKCGQVLDELMEKNGEFSEEQDAIMDEFFRPLMQR